MIQIKDPVLSGYAQRLQALIDRLDGLLAHPDDEEEKQLFEDFSQFLQEVPVPEWPQQVVQ